jgi:ethanolamine ammonia-lyase small subunit
MNDQKLAQLARLVIAELGVTDDLGPAAASASAPAAGPARPAGPAFAAAGRPVPSGVATIEPDEIPDIRLVDYRETLAIENPANPDEFKRIKARTWARLGLGHRGPRYTTSALLRFWADNAAAMDAVFTDVPAEFLESQKLFTVQTRCTSRNEYLTRPELGTRFDEKALAEITSRCEPRPQVQVYVADGLSSTAVEANIPDLLPALAQGLKLHGLTMGTPFFVRYGRVRSMEPISEALGATVTCVLLGERPGLATAESLSAYLAYEARVGMSESSRTCVSNIHQEGTNPVEAGAHLADIIDEMIKQKTSGIHLKLF